MAQNLNEEAGPHIGGDPKANLVDPTTGGTRAAPLRHLIFTPELRMFAIRLAGAMLLIGYLVMFAAIWPRVGLDWNALFLPLTQAFLHGQNPFDLQRGLFVPWALVFTVPFALLPQKLGVFFLFVFTAISYVYIARRLGAKELALVAFLFSPAVSTELLILNVDIFVFWGFVLPPPVAIPLLLIKPQVGGIYVIYLAIEAWREGGLRKLSLTLVPTLLVVVLSFAIFGNWIAAQYSAATVAPKQFWNTSLFPYSLVIGVPLAVLALWRRGKRAAMAATALCSPYITLPSWGAPLLACLQNDRLTVVLVVAMMILRITQWRGL